MTNHETYLGQKGYSIYKKTLSVKEQIYIREQLMVKPYVPSSPIQGEAYPIYRESNNKFYMPRFFGLKEFGIPNTNKVNNGIPISLNFNGQLRPNQLKIAQKYIDYILDDNPEHCGGLLDIQCGGGKTVLSLYIISKLKLKTLIIVHKGFLVDQWIERIQQFLPDAKIGRIQGQIIDIEGKDIVIGMLQSLSMKEYPEDLFQEFGLTVVDEAHHLSAEIFVRALQKIVTTYTLGLSATMNRKDGLTKVFKMFLGDIIHKEKRVCEMPVIVKAIEFKTSDEEFNTIEYDFRGNAKYSTMLKKLCEFNIRSEFIIQILMRELERDGEQQVMILAHNKSLLSYLYKAIEYRKIGTVGYYIGGMKQKDLKISETKQIIIATYSMASEALDIKTLTTVLFATPKTDIEQAVGRIMRENHNKALVIDIVDNHSIFKNQWEKRRKFYFTKGYEVRFSKNNNLDTWELLKPPTDKKTKEDRRCVVNIG